MTAAVADDRAAWLEERRKGVGGSDVAAIAGLHPYKSAWTIYWDKVLGDEHDAGEAALWGQRLEAAVAEEWAARHPYCPDLTEPGLVVDPDHPWRRGTPDRLVHPYAVTCALNAADAVLEVKLAGEQAWQWTWNGGADIPAHYQCQAQWYAALCHVDVVHFAVLVGGRRLETFTLARDDVAIRRLQDIADRFWHDHIEAGIPPDPDGSSDTRRTLDELYPPPPDPPVVCRLPAAAALLVDDYRAAAAELKAWTGRRDEAANRLIALLGEHEATDGYLGDTDTPAVTYRPVRRIDWEAVEAEHGDRLEPAWRVSWDAKVAERIIGRKALDAHRHPSDQRRLHVRGD